MLALQNPQNQNKGEVTVPGDRNDADTLPLPFIESLPRPGVTPRSLRTRFEDEDTKLPGRPTLRQ